MSITISEEDQKKLIEVMRSFGNPFARSLAVCMMNANDTDLQKLIDAFPDYTRHYCAFAGILFEESQNVKGQNIDFVKAGSSVNILELDDLPVQVLIEGNTAGTLDTSETQLEYLMDVLQRRMNEGIPMNEETMAEDLYEKLEAISVQYTRSIDVSDDILNNNPKRRQEVMQNMLEEAKGPNSEPRAFTAEDVRDKLYKVLKALSDKAAERIQMGDTHVSNALEDMIGEILAIFDGTLPESDLPAMNIFIVSHDHEHKFDQASLFNWYVLGMVINMDCSLSEEWDWELADLGMAKLVGKDDKRTDK